jgi:GntR family transcriptional repressor for pyruvate dehydrogenase complex
VDAVLYGLANVAEKSATWSSHRRSINLSRVPATLSGVPAKKTNSQLQPSTPKFHVVQGRRAFEEVIFQLEAGIAEGRIKKGDRLPSERELAETFGVGRPSVREALRALELFGVVSARRGTGADSGSTIVADTSLGLTSALRFHAKLSQISLNDLIDLRLLLEGHAIRSAALRKPRDTAALRTLAKAMHDADSRSFHTLDTGFHVEIARLSGNALLPVLMEALRAVIGREMERAFNEIDGWEETQRRLVREHDKLIDLIEAGDPENAQRAVIDHISGFYRRTRSKAVGAASDL